MPETSITTGVYLQSLRDGKLMGSRCLSCGATALPPRPVCGSCHGATLEPIELGRKGKLVAFSVITVGNHMMAAAGHDRDNPYCSGIVELEAGIRIPAQVIGADTQHPENINIGATGMIGSLVTRDNMIAVTFKMDTGADTPTTGS